MHGSWRSQQYQNVGVSAAPECGGLTSTRMCNVSAGSECGGLSSTRMWGSQQHQNVGLGVSAAPISGGLSSTRMWDLRSQQHQNLGVSAALKFSKEVSAAPNGSQLHPGLQTLLVFSARSSDSIVL